MGWLSLCYSDGDLGVHGVKYMRFPSRKRQMQKVVLDSIPGRVLEALSRREEEHCPEFRVFRGVCLGRYLGFHIVF